MDAIPYGRQEITGEDIDSVVNTLKSDYLTCGPKVTEFETAFSSFVGSKYAICCSNGTAALHLSTLASGIKPGDVVLTSPITFAASANSVLYAGGKVDFVDIDLETYLIDLQKLEKRLKSDHQKQVKAIIPVDLAGYPSQLEDLKKIADRYGLIIINDACHSPGGNFIDSKGVKQSCGNGSYADLAVFSFHPVKHIACGEGGMITTNSKSLYDKICMLRTHGITKDPGLLTQSTHGGWYQEMHYLGYNYRLSDILASLGLSQLSRARENLLKRQKIAEIYNKGLKELEVVLPEVRKDTSHAYHLYIIRTKKRKDLYNYLKEKKIFTQVHYLPVYRHPYYQQFGFKQGYCANAENYYEECLSLPMFPSLKQSEQQYVIDSIKRFFG